MSTENDNIDPSTPALYVLCGATRKKWRQLKSDVVMLGRSKGCDIGLVSPEVAPVHCVLIRTLNGWRIRDCSGRATRVNGKAIQDEPLHNGDVLQIGTFSFEAKLPPVPPVTVTPSPISKSYVAEHERLVRSRRHLVELALSLRQRVREQDEERKSQSRELEHAKHDLEQLEQRLRTGTGQAVPKPAATPPVGPQPAEIVVPTEQLEQFAARQAELDQYAAHLRRQAERLRNEKQTLAKQCEAERADFEADLIRQGVELKSQQESLEQWQQSLAKRNAELEKMAEELTEVLQHEREQLESDRVQVLRDREQLNQEHEKLQQMRLEIELLRAAVPQDVEPSSTRDTVCETSQPDRLASARKLLQELAQRRKTTLKPHAVVLNCPADATP